MDGNEKVTETIVPTGEHLEVIQSPPDTRLWVEAGAGSGKTEAVARRLAWLLQCGGLRPRQILVLSFSRAAVRVLVDRLRMLTEVEPALLENLRHLTVRTFDSWSFRMLRLVGEDAAELLEHGYDHNIALMLKKLKYHGDDDPLAADAVGLSQIRHVVTDEVQDLTGLRGDLVLTLLNRLAPPGKKSIGFTLLGDSNQAIYGFSANPEISKMTAPEFRKTVRKLWAGELIEKTLSKNHRALGPAVAQAAQARKVLSSAKTGTALPGIAEEIVDEGAEDGERGMVGAFAAGRVRVERVG